MNRYLLDSITAKRLTVSGLTAFCAAFAPTFSKGQSVPPCVSVFAESQTVSTNRGRTGVLGYLPGSTTYYRQATTSYNVDASEESSITRTLSSLVGSTTTYPEAGENCFEDSPTTSGQGGYVDYFNSYGNIDCFAELVDGVWEDGGTCNSHAYWYTGENCSYSSPPLTETVTETQMECIGPDWTYVAVDRTTLSSPKTAQGLMSDVVSSLNGLQWPSTWSPGGGSASLDLVTTQKCASGSRSRYRLRYVGPKGKSGTIEWIERLVPAGTTNIIDTKKTLTRTFTGEEEISPEYPLEPPSGGGTLTVIMPKPGSCGSCNLAQADFSNDSIGAKFGLGDGGFSEVVGYLSVNEKYPGAAHSRSSVKAFANRRFVDVVTDGTGVRQAKAPNTLVDLANVTGGYTVKYYSSWGSKDPMTGLYSIVGFSPFATWTLLQVSASPYTLEIRQTGGPTNTFAYNSGSWIWTRPDGTAEATTVITNSSGAELQVTRAVTGSGGTPVFDQVVSNIVLATGQAVPVMEIIGSGSATLTNQWFYETNVVSTHTNYGKLTMKIDQRGAWERYEYETNGNMLKRIIGFGNSGTNATESQSRVFEYSYTPVTNEGPNLAATSPRTIVEKLKGYEIARTYYIYRLGTNITIQCTRTNAAVDAVDNLFTTNRFFVLPNGTISITRQPDGLYEIVQLRTNSAGTYQTNITSRGVAAASEMEITEGTETTLISQADGPVVSRKARELPANVVTAHETYSEPDAQNRMRRTDYVLDGTFTYTTYAECCGQDSFQDREGVTTSYTHDYLKRLLTTTQIGITTSNVYDASGKIVATWRYGSNGPPIRLNARAYDRAGRISSSTNAMTNTTTYSYSFDAGTGRSKTTITYPDTGTRIEYRNKDGTLSEVAGTAVPPLTYTYDVEPEGGLHRAYTLESRSPSTHWVKSYTDMVGRTYKEVHAAASAPYPERRWVYNSKGQLTNMIEFNAVTNVYTYSTLGEIALSGIDMTGDSALTLASTDRRTSTTRGFSTNNGVVFGLVRTRVYTVNNGTDSIVTSLIETSVDGRHSWESGPGFTNKTYTVINSGAATRTVNSTNLDGSYTVTTYGNGRITSQNQYTSNGTQIGGSTFGYDDHGRQFKVIDVRTSTETVFLFNNADQVVTNTLTASGLPTQTSINFYDNMARPSRRIFPDGASVTNEYYLTGLLKKKYGAREYPVEYKYDAQGRMTNMTTWQSYPSGGAANTAWFYDGYRGWMTNKLDAAGKGAVYSYTAFGWLQTRGWARGTNTTYSYNAAGELTGIDYSDSTPDVTFTYDRRGQQTGITQGGATTTQVFNDAGQLLSQTANGLTVSNSYDLYFRRTNSGVWNGSAWLTRTEYTYDNASRLQKVGDGTNSATYAYLANSSMIDTVTFKENTTPRMTTTKTWDNLNRLKKIESVAGAGTVSSHTYAYNLANQRTSVTNVDSGRWVYEHDNLGQVISGKKYWADGSLVVGQQFEYLFDDIGNRKYAASGGNEWGTGLRYEQYTVNTVNQYTQRTVPGYVDVLGTAKTNSTVTVNNTPTYRKLDYFRGELPVTNDIGLIWLSLTNLAVLKDGANPDITTNFVGSQFIPKNPETFTYDLDGNLTIDGRWTNKWDAENRLISVESYSNAPDGSKYKIIFAYDSQWRRTSKIVSNWVGGAWALSKNIRLVYDGWNLIAELNATNSSVINGYTWGCDLDGTERGAGGVGGLLALKVHSGGNAGTHFYSYDGNGNVVSLASAADSAVAASYEYSPFGETIRATGPLASNPFRFSTKFTEAESDLVYYGYRFYSASAGRWLSRDPIAERGGMNLYCLAGNNAVDGVDALGLKRYSAVLAEEAALEKEVNQERCCCSVVTVPPTVKASIAGVASGEYVTEEVKVKVEGECPGSVRIIKYFWWDCFTAQKEYGADNSPGKPTGRQDWQDWGWNEGKSIKRGGPVRGRPPQIFGYGNFDMNDASHWNWQAMVLYTYCGKDGRYHANLAPSNHEEWSWLLFTDSWSEPHDGGILILDTTDPSKEPGAPQWPVGF